VIVLDGFLFPSMTVVIPMPRLLSATSTCLSQRHAIQRLQSRTFCASTRRSAQPFNSSALDTKQRPLSNARESAGPFHLGMTPSSQTKPVKKWSELSAAGKGACRQHVSEGMLISIPSSKDYGSYYKFDSHSFRRWNVGCTRLLPYVRIVFEELTHCAAWRGMQANSILRSCELAVTKLV